MRRQPVLRLSLPLERGGAQRLSASRRAGRSERGDSARQAHAVLNAFRHHGERDRPPQFPCVSSNLPPPFSSTPPLYAPPAPHVHSAPPKPPELLGFSPFMYLFSCQRAHPPETQRLFTHCRPQSLRHGQVNERPPPHSTRKGGSSSGQSSFALMASTRSKPPSHSPITSNVSTASIRRASSSPGRLTPPHVLRRHLEIRLCSPHSSVQRSHPRHDSQSHGHD